MNDCQNESLAVIAQNCPNMKSLDISSSGAITDQVATCQTFVFSSSAKICKPGHLFSLNFPLPLVGLDLGLGKVPLTNGQEYIFYPDLDFFFLTVIFC